MKTIDVQVTRVSTRGAINIGRPTALGNPFVMSNETDRNKVCDQYEIWFDNKVEGKDPAVMLALQKIMVQGERDQYIRLGCYCSPKRCHGDTIARWLRQHL